MKLSEDCEFCHQEDTIKEYPYSATEMYGFYCTNPECGGRWERKQMTAG